MLVDRELLLPAPSEIAGEQAWRFRHALVRDAAYASMPKATRARGHERLASWLATDRGPRPRGRRPDRHAPRASPRRRCRARARSAGTACARRPRRAAPRRGRRAARTAAAISRARSRSCPAPSGCSPTTTGRVPSCCPRSRARSSRQARWIGRPRWPTRRSPSASGSASRASAGAAAVERERLLAFRQPDVVDPDASLAVARRAVAALRALGDDLGLARAYTLWCEALWLKGSPGAGYRKAARVVHHARRARSGFEIDTGVSLMAWALVVNAVPVSEASRRCARLEREVAGRFAAMSVRGFGAVLDAMAGRFELARDELARARSGLAELRLKQASVWMAVFDAQAEMLARRRRRRRAGARRRGADRRRDRRPLVRVDDPRRPRARDPRAGPP